ncbi:hypothetical protein CNR22_07120 [Sphingobacteriaceae bacterium]|nr:hypothetical protein CNR22_07120 [Sphingobacteriaceae bacterium]
MKTLKSLFTVILFFGAQALFAAPAPPPSSSTSGPLCWPPPCVPIDNGIIFLIVAGVLFGAKKFYDLRKKEEVIS